MVKCTVSPAAYAFLSVHTCAGIGSLVLVQRGTVVDGLLGGAGSIEPGPPVDPPPLPCDGGTSLLAGGFVSLPPVGGDTIVVVVVGKYLSAAAGVTTSPLSASVLNT